MSFITGNVQMSLNHIEKMMVALQKLHEFDVMLQSDGGNLSVLLTFSYVKEK